MKRIEFVSVTKHIKCFFYKTDANCQHSLFLIVSKDLPKSETMPHKSQMTKVIPVDPASDNTTPGLTKIPDPVII